jgi:hypothetical protein
MTSKIYEIIQKLFNQNQLFSLEDIATRNLSPSTIKEELSRLAKEGLVRRYSYGLYYLPDPSAKTTPSFLDALAIRYIAKDGQAFGFFTGRLFLFSSVASVQENNDKIEIMTNKATSNKKLVYVFSHRIVLRKPYVSITQENLATNSFLSYIATTSFEEIEQNYSLLANYIRTFHLSANDVIKLIPRFPAKTFSKLLASDLYRSLWKH